MYIIEYLKNSKKLYQGKRCFYPRIIFSNLIKYELHKFATVYHTHQGRQLLPKIIKAVLEKKKYKSF